MLITFMMLNDTEKIVLAPLILIGFTDLTLENHPCKFRENEGCATTAKCLQVVVHILASRAVFPLVLHRFKFKRLQNCKISKLEV